MRYHFMNYHRILLVILVVLAGTVVLVQHASMTFHNGHFGVAFVVVACHDSYRCWIWAGRTNMAVVFVSCCGDHCVVTNYCACW